MRSPNKRSRSKSNRPKTLGNIVNRVFDSSGPEGKVRGTPQQIIEKYQVLARDAQLSNDRVAAENFQQHAEHYTRLLAQAQREMQAEQEARRQNHDDRNRQGNDDRNSDRNHDRSQDRAQSNGHQNQPRRDATRAPSEAEPPVGETSRDTSSHDSFSVHGDDMVADQGHLVETPESRSSAPSAQPAAQHDPEPVTEQRVARNTRKPRAPKPAAPEQAADTQPETAEAAAPSSEPAKPPRRYTRKPRQSSDTAQPETSQSAAE
ncbi:MAG: DUF4167 domain-containing protein [Roseinatronobacter sp.]